MAKKLLEIEDLYGQSIIIPMQENHNDFLSFLEQHSQITVEYTNYFYDMDTFNFGCIKPEYLHESWQTSGSEKNVWMAFNLYCNGTPSVYVTDLYSQKTGKTFPANFLLEVEDGRATFRLEFPKRKGKK